MSMENWKAIPGREGRYEVSDEGRIRSVTRQINFKNRRGKEISFVRRGKIIAPVLERQRRLRVAVATGSEKKRYVRYYVARLVLETFGSPPPHKTIIHHRDGNHLNCRVENLEWAVMKSPAVIEINRLKRILDSHEIQY